MRRPRVLIAGGSIGGLTAGLLLDGIGCDVEVYERSGSALQERGTGIVVLPVTERYFTRQRRSGPRVSLELENWTYVDRSGEVIASDPDAIRFSGWNTVYRALLDEFDPDRYHLDSEMTGFDVRDDGVTMRLADGSRIDGDLLVCADGIASTARSILAPEARPQYAGYVAWRGITAERQLSRSTKAMIRDAMVYQVLEGGHVLVYAIPTHEGDITPGRRVVNSVWYRNYPTGGPFEDLMTDRHGRRLTATVPPGAIRAEFVTEMRDTAVETLAPQLAEVVLGCAEPLVQAIYDLEVSRMAFGRVCLIGDAAFGLRPHVAAGQAKACADAWALGDALVEAEYDIDAALAAWEPRQLELGRAAVARTKHMGRRSQFEGSMVPGDPTWKFGLWEPGN